MPRSRPENSDDSWDGGAGPKNQPEGVGFRGASVKLHLDADASRKALHRALVGRGHDVTRTPDSWIHFDDSDEKQLLRATAQGRAIFTFNIRDFMALAQVYEHHRGIVLAVQRSWPFTDLLAALDRFLSETDADEVAGRVPWLSQWR